MTKREPFKGIVLQGKKKVTVRLLELVLELELELELE